jgi:hypothetical protein
VSTLTNQIENLNKIRNILLRIFCLCSITIFTLSLSAQNYPLGDSLKHHLQFDPKPTVYWNSYNSFMTGRRIGIQALKAGLIFNKRLTLGVGYHWMEGGVDEFLPQQGRMIPLKMRYASVFGEFVFYNKNNWVGTIPVQLGWGKSFLHWKSDGENLKWKEGMVVLYEPSISIEYKFSPWIAVGMGYGYRIMLKNNRAIDQNFYAPLYVFKARILFEELWERYQDRILTD